MAEWYYIGHYGQLGPLTREQIEELVDGGVIQRDTYVWKAGMADWLPASRVADLETLFRSPSASAMPPPPPAAARAPLIDPLPATSATTAISFQGTEPMVPAFDRYPLYGGARSDKSRIAAGVLQLVLPGVGRMYLGYSAIGVLQLLLAFCGGIGYIWSIIDGILMLTGAVRMDGYGRELGNS